MASPVDEVAMWKMAQIGQCESSPGTAYVVIQRKYVQKRKTKSWWPSPWRYSLGKHFFVAAFVKWKFRKHGARLSKKLSKVDRT